MSQSRAAVSGGDRSYDDERSSARALDERRTIPSASSDPSSPEARARRRAAVADRYASQISGRTVSDASELYVSRHDRPVAAAPGSRADRAASRPGDSPLGAGVAGRRTVTIRGRGAERRAPVLPSSSRRPERRYERTGFRPDRTAMWAVLLGVMLILAAAASAHAATLQALAH